MWYSWVDFQVLVYDYGWLIRVKDRILVVIIKKEMLELLRRQISSLGCLGWWKYTEEFVINEISIEESSVER